MSDVNKIFDADEIAQRIEQLADKIETTIKGDFVIVGLLKGSFMFVADLARALGRRGLAPRIEFMQVSSYGNSKESSGKVRINGEPPGSIDGRQVLLIDDIIDTGRTLLHTNRLLQEMGATRVWNCCLLAKPSRHVVECPVDFTGFEVDDVFVVGYGIDYAEKYRYLPYIGIVD